MAAVATTTPPTTEPAMMAAFLSKVLLGGELGGVISGEKREMSTVGSQMAVSLNGGIIHPNRQDMEVGMVVFCTKRALAS